MKVGQPFKCNHCGAQLTWRDTPVIECEYCHTRILMQNIATPTGSGKKPNVAMFVVGAALVGGVVIIATRAGRSSSTTSSTSSSSVTISTTSSTTITTSSSAPAGGSVPSGQGGQGGQAAGSANQEAPAIAKRVLEFGEEGTNAGQLSNARAIAVTPAGAIVVAETNTGRVQVFDATGAYQRVITLPGSTTTKELGVFGAGATADNKVVVSRSGDLVWLDPAAGAVTKTLPGSFPDIWFHGDVEGVPDGSVWATMDRTGDLNLAHVSAAGKLVKQVKNIGGEHIAIDGVGTMFITKQFDPAVEVRDAKLEIVRKFSQTAPGKKLSRPDAVALDGKGHVFVADSDKLHVFDPDGGYFGAIDGRGSIDDLAVDSKGAIYVLRHNHVEKYELTLPAK